MCQTCYRRKRELRMLKRIEGRSGCRHVPALRRSVGLVERLVAKPPGKEQAFLDMMRRTTNENSLRWEEVGALLKALGLIRWVGEGGGVQSGLSRQALQLECACGQTERGDRCRTMYIRCRGGSTLRQ